MPDAPSDAIAAIAELDETIELAFQTSDAASPRSVAALFIEIGVNPIEVQLGADAIIGWIESLLPDFVLLVDQLDGPRQAFTPFLDPVGLDHFLKNARIPQGGWSIDGLSDFDFAVLGCWGPSAWAGAQIWGLGTDQATTEMMARQLVTVAALLSIPIHGTTIAMDAEPSHRFMANVTGALSLLQRSFRNPRSQGNTDGRMMIERLIKRHLDVRLQEITALYAEIGPTGQPINRVNVPPGCDEHIGALLELHAWQAELDGPLSSLSISKHKIVSMAWRAGIRVPFGLNDPIIIDQIPRLQTIRRAHVSLPMLITEACIAVGVNLSAMEVHSRQLRRLTGVLQVIQALYGQIALTEAFLDLERPEIGLWEDLDPLARQLDSYLTFLLEDLDVIKAASEAESTIRDIGTVISSYKWSRIVFRSIQNANDIIFFITGAAGAGSAAASLFRGPPTGGAAVVASTAPLLRPIDLARLTAGANVMLAARNSGKSPPRTLAGRLGQRGEARVPVPGGRGQRLDPSRPRPGFYSLLNPRKWRIPDLLPPAGDFLEVKNVLRLSLTRQLTDFMIYAQATNRRLILYIRPAVRGRPGTAMSGPLSDAINILKRDGLIRVRYIPRRIR